MKTHHRKILLALCVVPLFSPILPVACAQPNRLGGIFDSGRIDVQIENGQLFLAPLKGQVDTNEFTFGAAAHGWPIESVPATIANLATYLRAADTNANVTVSPGAAEIQIKDLKLRGAGVAEVVTAVAVATEGAVHGQAGYNGNGRAECSFSANQAKQNPERTVEVFNISGYLSSLGLGTNSDTQIEDKLDQIKGLIAHTVEELHTGESKRPDLPQFEFHKGTGLFIAIGSPEAIEVTRKIVDALPGQESAQLKKDQQLFDELDKTAAKKQK